jgi:membrane-associated phospholipid phosphatase
LNNLARIISTILSPPTLAVLSVIFLAVNYEAESIKKFLVIAIALLFGFVFPIGMVIYLYRNKLISDVDATQKAQRTIPYYIAILIYTIGFILLLLSKVSQVSIAFWFCYISNTFLVILINRYLKISIHALGVSGPLALFVFLIGIKGLFLLPILLAVGWSRIRLKVHTLSEVLAGAVFGFVTVYFQLIIFLG